MIITDFDNLECTLPALEKVVFNPSKRYAFRLKSNANHKEVEQFFQYVGERLFAYQVLNYYEFLPELPKGSVTVKHQFDADIDNQVNNIKEGINRYIVNIKTTLKNPHAEKNKGKPEVEVDWYFAGSAVSTYSLNQAFYINTEDLRFNIPQANFFGRSLSALFLRQFAVDHPAIFQRNFEILKAEDQAHTDSFKEIVMKQRDLSLTAEDQKQVLLSLKCLNSGKDGTEIMKKNFSLTA